MVIFCRYISVLLLTIHLVLRATILYADIKDPFDPFDSDYPLEIDSKGDDEKSAQQLISEAGILMDEERPLDARTKLLKALQKEPKEYRAHLMLAAYYMVNVGHFRLALKYVKQAQALFSEKNGEPPYKDFMLQSEHAHILYLLSQARLNLDDYQGALAVLDEFSSYGYYADWYSGTRAWVLMKLGKIDEAIRVARWGLVVGSEKGRTLNMLGILLSMSGERQSSLDVFRQAINFELSMGTSGQPATPLNNMGEVYKEVFEEDKAQSSWLKATSFPDGCDHVLPSLNLSMIYMDELNLAGAKRAMDSFQACVAQFPLRNGEEHVALVNLARGRIDQFSGHVDSAVSKFESALEHQQWFGKIGTNIDDLRAGAMISLGQALQNRTNVKRFWRYASWGDYLVSLKERLADELRSRWYMRRSRQILIEDLSALEDIYVRNTDSLLDYATLGQVLASIPTSVLEERIHRERAKDNREEAGPYYDTYLAENYLAHGNRWQSDQLLSSILSATRGQYDDALRLHVLLLKLSLLAPRSTDYTSVAYEVFSLSRPALRNYGYTLPVNFSGSNDEMRQELESSAFLLDNNVKLEYSINYEYKDGEYVIEFASASKSVNQNALGGVRVKSSNLEDAVNKFTDEIFSIDLK